MNPVILVFINCLMLSAGQTFWKTGLEQVNFNTLVDLIHLLFNKYILAGIGIYITSTFYWFWILKRFDLIRVYPLQSMSYILVLVLGSVILKELPSRNTIIGTLIIVLGVFIVTKH